MKTKKRILVTGGLGYIGSHTVVELQEAGYEVYIIDNLSNSRPGVADRIASITGIRPHTEIFDLQDRDRLLRYFQEHRIDGVIHFAASKAVGESVQKPLHYYRNNLVSLMNVLEAMRASGSRHIIFSSSCTVYGQADQMPITENAPLKPAESPYGNTKKISEDILSDFAGVSDIRVVSLRYFNPIGAHPSAQIGELPLGVPQNLVPFITQTAAGIREELSVFGSDYPTPDGTAIRDYIHVVDLAQAHIAALKYLSEGKNSDTIEFFNVGTGKGSSVLEVIHAFERATGVKLRYKMAPRRPGDITEAYADTTKANRILGWKARKTLEQALYDAWQWQKTL